VATRWADAPSQPHASSSGDQSERSRNMFWDAEESDRHPSRSLGTCIASQSLCPGEPRMGTLCAGKACRLDSQTRRSGRPDLDRDATFRAGAGYRRVGGLDDSSPARGAAHPQRQADGAGRSPGAAYAFRSPDHSPLLAQRAGAATANAGGIHRAQASISFSAVFVRNQLLVNRTPRRPIELASKVLAGKAAGFPGGGR
jgi:hypothetical protein